MSVVILRDSEGRELLTFAPNLGILVETDAVKYSDRAELIAAIELAEHHIDDELFVEGCCGGRGPLADGWYELSYAEYLAILEKHRVDEATKAAKRAHTRVRRREFQRVRSNLVLAMIEAGTPYLCADESCTQTERLHVDHIKPVSRGGTDDLDNLQFLCASHNARKSDRVTS